MPSGGATSTVKVYVIDPAISEPLPVALPVTTTESSASVTILITSSSGKGAGRPVSSSKISSYGTPISKPVSPSGILSA